MSGRLRPIIYWPGGKSRHLKSILARIPHHETYVEVFGGGLAVLCAKSPSKVEVINDVNHDLVNLYRVVRHHSNELIRETRHHLNARLHVEDFRHHARGLTDIQAAARFLVLNRLAFGGAMSSYSCKKQRPQTATDSFITASIRALRERLDRVTIECLDWRKLLDLYDRKPAFFFLDPPYLTKKNDDNYSAWSVPEMTELRDRIRHLEGEWLLTIDNSPECVELFSAFTCVQINVLNKGRPWKCNREPIGELIVSNR